MFPLKRLVAWLGCLIGSLVILIAGSMVVARQATPQAPFIAFSSAEGGNLDIYRVQVDGIHRRNITQSEAAECCPAWSPDGKWIAFSAEVDGNMDLYRQTLYGHTRQQLTDTESEAESNPAWHPDGESLLFVLTEFGRRDIYQIDLSGQRVQITDSLSSDAFPTWLPDGQQIAFLSFDRGERDVFVWDVQAGIATQLTFTTDFEGRPRVVPQQSVVSYVALRDRQRVLAQYSFTTQEETIKPIADGVSGDYHTWSPDGEWVAFVVNGDIYRERADGTARQLVTENGSYPDWSPVIDLPWRVGVLIFLALGFIIGSVGLLYSSGSQYPSSSQRSSRSSK